LTTYPQGSFGREDETDDPLFYAEPRLVVHIDDYALGAIASYFEGVLPHDGVILDLMSSWRSHLPENLPVEKLVGLGLNDVEMTENPQLNHAVVHDINADPKLPFDDGSFDAVMVTVSIQYIVRPLEVFAEVNRTLKEGASFHVVYSNRMFPTKAVAIWKGLDDARRADLISSYFNDTGGWDSPQALDIGSRQITYTDPVYVVCARKAVGADTQVER
jgi:SAM-dependent methyltransferase